MNFLDIIIAVPLLWGIFRGFAKGLIIEVASLIAIGAGVYFGLHFSYFITGWLGIKSDYAPLTGFIFTFLLVVISVFLLAKVLEKSVDILSLGLFNKLAGSFFSLVKFTFILSIIFVITNRIDSHGILISEKKKQESLLYYPVSNFAPFLIPKLGFDKIARDSMLTGTQKDTKTDKEQK